MKDIEKKRERKKKSETEKKKKSVSPNHIYCIETQLRECS